MKFVQPNASQMINITSVTNIDQRVKIMFDWTVDPFIDFIIIAKSRNYQVFSAERAFSENCVDSLYRTKDIWRDNGGGFLVDYGYTYTLFPYMSHDQTVFAQTENNSTGIIASVQATIKRQKRKKKWLNFLFTSKGEDEMDEVHIIWDGVEGLPDDLGNSCWYQITAFDYKYPISLSKLKDGVIYIPSESNIIFYSESKNGNYISVMQRGQ